MSSASILGIMAGQRGTLQSRVKFQMSQFLTASLGALRKYPGYVLYSVVQRRTLAKKVFGLTIKTGR